MTIHTESAPNCQLCGANGEIIYRGLVDRLFSAPGTWSVRRCTSPDCRLLWLDPRPHREDIDKIYAGYYTHRLMSDSSGLIASTYKRLSQNYVAHRYAYRPHKRGPTVWPLIFLHPGARAEADFSVLYQFARPEARLLDVGCGSGDQLSSLVRLGWQKVEGVEPDADAVTVARTKGLRVHHGTLASCQFENESFDVITLSHVIEHVIDPVDLLREVHRVLKPRGSLLVITPNSLSLGHSLFKRNWVHLDPPRHINLFNPRNLLQALHISGYWSNSSIVTTVRAAGPVLDASLNIKNNGFHRRSFFSAGRWRQLQSHAFYYAEAAVVALSPLAGEEMVLRASKRPP